VLTDHQKKLRKSIRQQLTEQAEKNSAWEIEVEIFDLSIDLEFHDWQIIHTPEYFKQKDQLRKQPWYQKAYMLKTLKAYYRNKKENPGR
jgi:glycogen synthase